MGTKRLKDKAKMAKWFGRKMLPLTPVAIVTPKAKAESQSKWITFIPKRFLNKVPTSYAIISLGSRGDYVDLEAMGFNEVLRVKVDVSKLDSRYNPERLDAEKVKDIIMFVCKNADKPIIIHCGEGMCRSPAIAEALAFSLRNIEIDFSYPGCEGDYYGDSGITRDFLRIFDETVSNDPEVIPLIKEYEQ